MKISDIKHSLIGKKVYCPSFDVNGTVKSYKVTKFQISVLIMLDNTVQWHNSTFDFFEPYKDIPGGIDQLKQYVIL